MKGNEIPPQFLLDEEIYVTIIKVKDPAHFIIKESPSIKSPRTLEFLEFEDAMQKYYKRIEQAFFPLPSRDALVVVHFENKFYRAKVCSILNMTRGHIIKVYLVDYGKQCNVTRPCLYEIPEDFLKLPFQAVDFRFDLKPISLVMNLNEITFDYGPVTEWDVSASTFINDLFKAVKNAFVKVKHADQGYVIGSMYVSLQNGEIKCINDELVLKKFAQERSKCMNDKIVLLSATDKSIQKEKSILDSSQPVAVPTLISKPKQNENVSSTQKLRALLKKRYIAQNGIKSSTEVKESVVPNNDASLESANKGKEFGANLSKQEKLQKDIQPKQNGNISSTQKLRALIKKRYIAQNGIKSSTEVKESVVPNNDASLKSANNGKEFGANLSKREELQKDIQHNHLEDTKDSNKVLKSTLYNSSTDFASSSGSEVLTEANDISKNITVDAMKKNLREISERKALFEKFRKMYRKNRLRALAEGKENSSNVVVQTSEESREINSTVKSEHKIESSTSEMKQNMTQETSCMKSDVETLICEPKENVITEASCIVNNPEQVIFDQDCFEMNDSSSESEINRNLLEISKRKALFEKFRKMYRKNRLRALAEGKENSSNVVVQTSEESREINSTVKSEHKIESSTSEMKQNMTQETSCMKSDVETLICEPKENVITEASCIVNNPEQVVFDQDCFEMNNSSSESEINRNLREISERKALFEKFRKMYRKNRLRALAEGKENSSNVVVQTSEESREINSTVKSEHKIESSTSEMKQNMTQETSCMKSDVETLICEPKENVITEASCIVNNPEQVIFDQDCFEMNDSSSESEINSHRSSTSIESEVESQLNCERHENSVSVNFGLKDFGDNHIPAICLGKNVPDFVFSLSDISFSSILKKTLEKLNFEGPSSVQSAAWPAAKRNLSYAAIAPPHSGKTAGYLLPIVSNFLNKVYNGLPKTRGPVAIIICSSWKKVFAVQDLLNLFLDGFKLKILTCFADGKRKRNRIVTLMNGCDILISIPSILLNLFKEDVICIKRCCHLILDDGTNLMADHIKEIKETIRMFSAKFKRENEQIIPLQIVINSERWTNRIASFVDICMKNSFLLFTSYLEAAIHAQIPVIPHVCNESEKDNRLLSLIKANEGKIVVCTKEMDKALHIHSFLKSENVRSFLITEEMEHYISEDIIQDWKSVCSHLPYCLVSTDSALTVKIKEADCIIHYDVPEMSRLQFGYRFSCMTERLMKQDISKCESHILLSETCYSQAKALMKIIKRTGKGISKEMRDLVIKQEKIQCPPDVPLCHYFKAFGKCKLPICTKRHYISSVRDKPNIVPNEGDVHAMVTHVFDATHFYVKILRYLPPDGEQLLSMSCEYAKLCSNLRKYYSVESNRKVVKDPVVGENYIIRDSNKLAYRVKVLDLLNLEETKCQKITLLYRDEGFIRSYDHWELFEDIDFGCLSSPHAVEVYLCNVCTPDSCPEWNAQANHFVRKLVLNKEVHGKIALCLGETLFLHPFALREKMKFVEDYINILSVESSLIKDGFARENKKHIETLKIACKNKIPLPNIKKTNPPPENATEFKPEISYAFLEMNAYEDVYVSSVISPQQVYVQRVKFVKCLEELLEKINAKVAAGKVKKCSTLLKGMHCIAPFDEDNRYYRAVVTNVSPDNDDVQLFFVDFGDSCYSPKDSIYDLSPEFMLLPFQAIECELDGISAPHGGWSDKCIEYFTDLTKDEEGCMKILELKAFTKLICYDAGNRYKVDIWNGVKTLSEQLLEEGFANPGEKCVPAEISVEPVDKEFDENIPSGYAASTSDDDDVPSDNKYHHSLFCIALAKMMMEGMSNSEAVAEAKKEISEKKEQKEDRDYAAKITDTLKTQKFPDLESHVRLTSPVLALQRLLKYAEKRNKIKEKKPKISWWDSSKYVYILVKLKDVQIYELNVQDNLFTFKTSHKGSDYFIEEEFYSLIFSKNFDIKTEFEGLRLILEKQENVRWPHLTKQNVKVPYIKYDLNHIDDSDCEDSFQESIPTKRSPIVDEAEEIGIDDPSDEDSDDDYLMPWQKIAEFKEKFNWME